MLLPLQRLQVPIRSDFFFFFVASFIAEFECASLLSAWKRNQRRSSERFLRGSLVQNDWVFKIQIDMWGLDPVAER